jgi:GT2 family glycosyltransferase
MKISVIIATRNRLEDLKLTLQGFLCQEYKNFEIIVIDNASTDGTREMMVNDFPEIQYLWLPVNIDILAQNIGVELSSGDIIWRTDSDSFPENEFVFDKAIEVLRDNQNIHIICCEDIEVRKNYEIWDWYPIKIDKVNIPPGGYPAHTFAGSGAAIRKEVFETVGGFWEFGFEEIDFCTRAILAGYNIRYFPNIRVHHYASPNDRVSSDRWVQVSKQLMRYYWKYYPLRIALPNTFSIYLFQTIAAVMDRVGFKAIIEGWSAMFAVMLSTSRKERQIAPDDKINDITLGQSLIRQQLNFLKHKFKSGLKRWVRK